MNIYHSRAPPKVGVGDGSGGGRLNKDAQEVILQGYIQRVFHQRLSQNGGGACGGGGAVGDVGSGCVGGGVLVLEVARMVVQGCRESRLHLTAV